MENKSIFLRWALFTCLVVVGACIVGGLGWWSLVFKDDPTYLTFATLGVFVLATTWIGRLSWRMTRRGDPFLIRIHHKDGWFASSVCVSIGLIGTLVGFYILYLQGLSVGGDSGAAIANLMGNARIAIINSIFGGVCGVLVEAQSHYLGKAIELELYRRGWVVDDNGNLVRVKEPG